MVNQLSKTKTVEYEGFPRIYKMPNGLLQIVFRNRSELYILDKRYNDSGENEDGTKKPFDAYNEIQMIEGNGGRQVHCSKTVKVIDFTR